VQARRDALLQEEETLRRRISRAGGRTGGGGAGTESLHTVIEDLTNALATNASRSVAVAV
jgi:hypothetical protein